MPCEVISRRTHEVLRPQRYSFLFSAHKIACMTADGSGCLMSSIVTPRPSRTLPRCARESASVISPVVGIPTAPYGRVVICRRWWRVIGRGWRVRISVWVVIGIPSRANCGAERKGAEAKANRGTTADPSSPSPSSCLGRAADANRRNNTRGYGGKPTPDMFFDPLDDHRLSSTADQRLPI